MKAAGLEPVGLHELRHALASVAIAAGVTDLKRIQSWMGHATMAMTIDCYGHLLQTGEEEARAAVNAFLARERAVEHLRPRSGHAAPRSALQRGFRGRCRTRDEDACRLRPLSPSTRVAAPCGAGTAEGCMGASWS